MGIIARCITTTIRIITIALTIIGVIIPMSATVMVVDIIAMPNTETVNTATEIIRTAGAEMGITQIEIGITTTTPMGTGTTVHRAPEIELATGMTEMEMHTTHVVEGLAISIRIEIPGIAMSHVGMSVHEHVAEPGRMNILFHCRVYLSGQDKLTATEAEM